MEPISGLWLSPQPLETVNLTAEQGAWLIDSRGQQSDTSAWAPALSSGYPVNQSGSGSTQDTCVFFPFALYPIWSVISLGGTPEKSRKCELFLDMFSEGRKLIFPFCSDSGAVLILIFYVESVSNIFYIPLSLPNQEKQNEDDLLGHAYTESWRHLAMLNKMQVTSSCHPGCVILSSSVLNWSWRWPVLTTLGPQKTSARIPPGLTVPALCHSMWHLDPQNYHRQTSLRNWPEGGLLKARWDPFIQTLMKLHGA